MYSSVRKIIFEVVKKPLATRKYGVSALLFYVMRGTSSKLHSKAEKVLQLLMDDSIFDIGEKFNRGSDTIVEVLILAFQRLCEEIEPNELKLMWKCLYVEVADCIKNKRVVRLSYLLSLLVSMVQINDGRRVSDYQPMLDALDLLLRTLILPTGILIEEDNLLQVLDKVLQLMLCILSGLHNHNDMSTISACSLQWAPVFGLKNSRLGFSLLTFMRGLLRKDPSILNIFRVNILRAMNTLIETSQEQVVYLLLSVFERLHVDVKSFNFLDGRSEDVLSKIQDFMRKAVSDWIKVINDILSGNASCTQVHETDLALLWGIVSCFPYMFEVEADSSLLIDLRGALDELLMAETENVASLPRKASESIIGAALKSYSQLLCGKKYGFDETREFLQLARRHKSCSQVLSAVADFLDSFHGPMEEESSCRLYHPELSAERITDALSVFADNLCHWDKGIRVATLRILCHYEPLNYDTRTEDQPVAKKMKTEASQTCHMDSKSCNVLRQLLSIETTPLSVTTSRKVTLLISKVQMDLSAGRIPEAYVPLLLNGIIGVFHNRFSNLWNPASECLALLISQNFGLVWEEFINYFGKCLSIFQDSNVQLDKMNANFVNKSSDLVERFNLFVTPASDSTPSATVLSLLLQSLQRIPALVESRSRHIAPLFFKFLGYKSDDLVSSGQFNSLVCKGKEWKSVLKEWLNLLRLMRNLKSFYLNQFLKDILQNRLLDENDAEVQMKVLDCLSVWKDNFLLPYEQHLKNLSSSDSFREELTTWSLSRESHQIEEHHRAYLLPLVIRILMPKVRKLKKRASRKHSSVNFRKAVLGFIAQLDVDELPLFFTLLIKPLQIIFVGSDGTSDWYWDSAIISIEKFRALNFLKHFSVDSITALSWKKRYGFLHVIEDILGVFDELRVRPFLDFLMGCVVRILGSCTCNLDIAKGCSSSVENHSGANMTLLEQDSAAQNMFLTSSAQKQFKDLRSLCLKIVSFVLNKYEDHDFGCEFWDLFFNSIETLVDGFKKEGFSGEKPSSLFSCFIVMTKSDNLVPLLYRKDNLVPDIFSFLTVPSASEAIITGVLKFIENLLILDNELDEEESAVRKVLLPNVDALISNLQCFFLSDSAIKRKLVKSPGETELRIFNLLSKYIKDPPSARKFVDILLPFITKGVENLDVCLGAIEVVRYMIPISGKEMTRIILNAISPLFVAIDRAKRSSLCDLVDTLAVVDPSVRILAELVHELNATSAMELDDLDYDTIQKAYQKITVDFFYTIKDDQALVILSHCVHDMKVRELMPSAFNSLVEFVKFSALILGKEVNDNHDMPHTSRVSDDGWWTKACIQRMISKILLKHMGNTMKGGDTFVWKEWIKLLNEMVKKLPQKSFNSLKALCDEDPEMDFFNNIIHVQKHRVARALLRFKNVINSSCISEDITNKVFIPLYFNLLFDEGKQEHVKNACIEALASISRDMDWKSYYSLLTRCFSEMAMNPDKQKILVRLICSILDQFHFSEAKDSCDNASDSGTKATGSSLMLQVSSDSAMASEIQTCLHKVVLPKIQKLLDSDSGRVNVNINLAALKILKVLPGDIMDSQLPTIVHRISNFLKNRLESIRDDARSALAACLKELGLEYLQFIVKVLRTTLKRGFELHVLGYTLNSILSKFLSTPVTGKLDYCLEDLLSVVESDILGDVSEEKEVEKIASKMKETRKRMSFETLKLIAQSVTFKTHAMELLSPVTSNLQKHLNPKVKTKLESMLNSIALGIECNPSVNQTDLFIFVYGLVEDGIKNEHNKGESSSTAGVNGHGEKVVRGKRLSSRRIIDTKSLCSHLIVVFALKILHKRVKNVKMIKSDARLLSMLDPYVSLLGNCLSSKYEDVLSASLKCLTPLVRMPLPSIESQADKIKAALFDIAQSTVNASSSLMQSCLNLLTVLLGGTKITLSSEELHLLVQFPLFDDLKGNPSFVALALLKAMVKRKLVVPKIYDLVTQVAELMVTSQVEPIRQKCSQILLRFLLDYHLSEKRLQQHLDFLLSNLRFEHPIGRKAVLEMLHTIIIKFPKSVVDEQSQTFFVHLVVCLANDQDNEVRSMSGAAIKHLIGHLSQRSLHSILEYSISWYLGEKQQLWSAAAQVLGLLVEVEVMKTEFQRHISTILPVARSILQSTISGVTNTPLTVCDEFIVPFWKEAYYSLIMLEKMLHQFQDMCFKRDLEDLWEAICELLLHPHMWLRNISSRLVALYFATVTETSKKNHEKSIQTHFLMRPSRLFKIAVSLCCQLKTKLDDDTARDLITENLAFAICGVHSLMGLLEHGKPQKFWATLEPLEQGCFLKSLELLETKKGQSMFLSLTSGVSDKNDEGHPMDIRFLLVSNLLKKMGKIVLQKEDVQMKIVFGTFKKISVQISGEDHALYAFDILLPLYKVCEGFAGKVISDDIKQLAQEVCESLRKTFGTQLYVETYNEIRKHLKAKRDKRKTEEKLMAVVNPTRHAKRKLKIAAKHRANKKRKIMRLKFGRLI
ncbi:uncharacterized protein LOC107422300 isoform X3 [Ziziphus jujuba]|uniref:Uncharacterized protein LOC107422300 isoform X3 n=1 Tax=Ziziphus jujuba TaxID=326968 RepID=A0ABM3IS01_ZIZJJ|nr:uncharacterized protein LOC107422300 isoform X3 [Ziziphus jujuba]